MQISIVDLVCSVSLVNVFRTSHVDLQMTVQVESLVLMVDVDSVIHVKLMPNARLQQNVSLENV